MASLKSQGAAFIGFAPMHRALDTMPANMQAQLSATHGAITNIVVTRARAAAPGYLKSAIQPGGYNAARAEFFLLPNPPYAGPHFFGKGGRSGWYAAPQYRGSTGLQFQPWVGAIWVPGEEPGKPYFIGDAVNKAVQEIAIYYMKAADRAAKPAFPLPFMTRVRGIFKR